MRIGGGEWDGDGLIQKDFTTPASVEQAIAQARMLYLSGISQGISTSARDAVFAAIDVAVRHGVKVAFDTNYRPRLWPPARAAAVMHAAMAHADYAMPGEEDVRTLTDLTDPDAMLDFDPRPGSKLVLLKMGQGGAYLATADARVRIPAYRVVLVDATGAGDTFRGSFLASILAGDVPEPAARYAGVAAALKCKGYGAVAPIPTAASVRAAFQALADRDRPSPIPRDGVIE